MIFWGQTLSRRPPQHCALLSALSLHWILLQSLALRWLLLQPMIYSWLRHRQVWELFHGFLSQSMAIESLCFKFSLYIAWPLNMFLVLVDLTERLLHGLTERPSLTWQSPLNSFYWCLGIPILNIISIFLLFWKVKMKNLNLK